jgi:hypothetical protein
LPADPEHGVNDPVIAPGVAGAALFNVMDIMAADEVPQAFEAVTVTFPEVAPIVTVADIVP